MAPVVARLTRTSLSDNEDERRRRRRLLTLAVLREVDKIAGGVLRRRSLAVANETHRSEPRIVVDPEILVGKPVIRGTRIPVHLILNLLGNGYDFERITQAYPALSREDIRAAIQFAEARMKREETRNL